jgi:ABC-type arginine/histidine transport system permease subunit
MMTRVLHVAIPVRLRVVVHVENEQVMVVVPTMAAVIMVTLMEDMALLTIIRHLVFNSYDEYMSFFHDHQ